MRYRVAAKEDVLPGGLKLVQAGKDELVLCNHQGTFYALERRCGHMNAPLELGSLNQYILTCPMHSAQFSVVTGEVMNGAIPSTMPEKAKDGPRALPGYTAMLVNMVRTRDIRSYPVTVEGEDVYVDV
jgi:nitrite reductase/ring-hydroxylating ferredoxin subunit